MLFRAREPKSRVTANFTTRALFGGATWTRTRKEGLKVLYDNHFITTPLLRIEASL